MFFCTHIYRHVYLYVIYDHEFKIILTKQTKRLIQKAEVYILTTMLVTVGLFNLIMAAPWMALAVAQLGNPDKPPQKQGALTQGKQGFP